MRDATGAVQSILVLGGGSSLGASIAASLCGARHATVVLAGRDRAHLERAAAQLGDAGAGRIEMIAFDALDYDSHESVVEQAAGLVGDIDVVVLAFGLLGAGDHLVPGGHTDAVTVAATNYVGAVSTGLAAAGHLRRQGHGTIVVLSSVAAQRVRRANFVYGSSKAGTDGFATGLRAALAGSGVEVLTVRPGWVATAMTRGRSPAPFATTADTVGAATARAFAAHRHTVWVPAGLRLLFLGLRQLPAFIWNRLPG